MSRKNKPGALDEFLERQELGTNPAKNVGNFRPGMPIFMLGRVPLFRLLLGVCCGVPAAIGLINALGHLPGDWLSLICYTFLIALSVLLVIGGIRNLRSNGRRRKFRQR